MSGDILSQIASSLERIAACMERDQKSREQTGNWVNENQALTKASKRIWRLILEDNGARYPGLEGRVKSQDYLAGRTVVAVGNIDDPLPILDALTRAPTLLRTMHFMEDGDLEKEIAVLQRRVAMGSVAR